MLKRELILNKVVADIITWGGPWPNYNFSEKNPESSKFKIKVNLDLIS
jgi:hypothetical protein